MTEEVRKWVTKGLGVAAKDQKYEKKADLSRNAEKHDKW